MTLHSIHFTQYAHALPLTIIPPTPHFHYANIAYGTQFSNALAYAIHTQFSRIWFSVLQSALCFSLRLCFSSDVCKRQTLGGPRTGGTHSWLDDTDTNFGPDLLLLFKLHEIWSVDS